jgi:hypothetical protein
MASRPDGWVVLFDGSGDPALRAYGGASFPVGPWRVESGALRAVPGTGVDLVTDDAYGDFELEFAWRVSAGGNSGVMYRVVESGEPAWTTGPEYQVLDDDRHPDGRRPETSATALYDLAAPSADKRLRPVGDYNDGRIIVRGKVVEHWLNGARVLTYTWGGQDIVARIRASKFANLPTFMAAASGRIVFQHHGEEAWFRDIRIRELGAGG